MCEYLSAWGPQTSWCVCLKKKRQKRSEIFKLLICFSSFSLQKMVCNVIYTVKRHKSTTKSCSCPPSACQLNIFTAIIAFELGFYFFSSGICMLDPSFLGNASQTSKLFRNISQGLIRRKRNSFSSDTVTLEASLSEMILFCLMFLPLLCLENNFCDFMIFPQLNVCIFYFVFFPLCCCCGFCSFNSRKQ